MILIFFLKIQKKNNCLFNSQKICTILYVHIIIEATILFQKHAPCVQYYELSIIKQKNHCWA